MNQPQLTKQHLHVNWSKTTNQTYVLNLDSEFTPVSGNIFLLKFEEFTFPGGEPHFKITTDSEHILKNTPLVLTSRFREVGDLFKIMLAVDAARKMGLNRISLVLPYFPGARQDRVCNIGEPLTVKIFADIINALNFEEVHTWCPHSDVTAALVNNIVVHDESSYVVCALSEYCTDGATINIVCPDAGAGKRVSRVVSDLCLHYPNVKFNYIRCEKVRDVATGKLTSFFVGCDNLQKFPTLIVDDIVSMGGTFIGLGNELRKNQCGPLMLYTTHADCIEGLEKMVNFFDHVYVTNSKKNWNKFTWMNLRLTSFDIKHNL
jgi:ribose-phosphate pyrophosphokinase